MIRIDTRQLHRVRAGGGADSYRAARAAQHAHNNSSLYSAVLTTLRGAWMAARAKTESSLKTRLRSKATCSAFRVFSAAGSRKWKWSLVSRQLLPQMRTAAQSPTCCAYAAETPMQLTPGKYCDATRTGEEVPCQRLVVSSITSPAMQPRGQHTGFIHHSYTSCSSTIICTLQTAGVLALAFRQSLCNDYLKIGAALKIKG